MSYKTRSGAIFARLSANQVINLGPGNHLSFDQAALTTTGLAILDTTSPYTTVNGAASVGRFSLAPGNTYILSAGSNTNIIPGNLQLQWFNADTGVALPASNISFQDSDVSVGPSMAIALFSPSLPLFTLVEVRIISNTGPAAFEAPNTYALIQSI